MTSASRRLALVLLCLLLPSPARAQTATAWPEQARPIADYVSSGMVAATVIAEEVHQYKSHGWTGVGCSALVLAASNLEAIGIKALVHEERPNRVDDKSFLSQHAANAFSVGWQANVSIPIGIGVGYLRTAADWHWWWDVVAGALLGTANRYLVSLIPACAEVRP